MRPLILSSNGARVVQPLYELFALIYLDSNCVEGSEWYDIKNIRWPRTVRLTISVRYPFEILLLLKKKAMPLLEYLDVTIEGEHVDSHRYGEKSQAVQFCANDIHRMVKISHLRTLVVRHLALDQVTILLQHLDLPVLNKLTLVNIFDDST